MQQESLNRITTILASHFNRETDEPFKRMLAVRVDYWRSTLIQRSLEKHPEQRKFYRQTLWVPMEVHSLFPLNKLPVPLPNVSQSVAELPVPIRHKDVLFDYVGSIDGRNAFREAGVGTIEYLQEGKYSGKTVFYRYEENLVKVEIGPGEAPIPKIRIDGVFDKPLEVMKFNCNCSNIDCNYWDQPYPITGDVLQSVIQYVLEVDYQRAAAAPSKETEVNQSVTTA